MLDQNHNSQVLEAALIDAAEYPRNVFAHELQEHSLNTLNTLLRNRSKDLFCADQKAAVIIFELYREDEGYHKSRLKDLSSFNDCLTAPLTLCRPDPRRRYIFINAPSSRSSLKATKQMFFQLLTYHYVNPAFLHYVFPFGKQHYVRDFHVMGFRSHSCIERPSKRVAIPKLLRSGRHIEMSYSLKSAEEMDDDPNQKWSIRQCSVYHKFDVEHEQMVWILVKGNRVVQDHIQRQCQSGEVNDPTDNDAFPESLASHQILATWCAENWHWYITDLELAVQSSTNRGVYLPMEQTPPSSPPTRKSTFESETPPKPSRRPTASGIIRSFSNVFRQGGSSPSSWEKSGAVRQTIDPEKADSTPSVVLEESPAAINDFSFQDLQDVHHFEVKANEALLILKANGSVIADLRQEYTTLMQSDACPASLREKYQGYVTRFDQQLSAIQHDLALQQDKVEILLRMIADRKNFLQSILQNRNMQATKLFAEKAQESAENMELMTKEMHNIAMKTKVETVSMRIITLVTLFFLPGTFISTLMSTPMVRFNSTKPGFSLENIGVGALQLYLLVSIPLVLLTFMAWFAVYKWEKRRGKQEEARVARIGKGEV